MKSLFQKLLLSLLFGAALSACLIAQESKQVQIVINPADTTYRVAYVQTYTDETNVPADVQYLPKDRWLKRAEIGAYLFQLAKQSDERKTELQRLQNETKKECDFFIATLDTLFGAGTYLNTIKAEFQAAMQGNWTLIERDSTKTPDKWTVQIAADKVTSGNKTGTLTFTDGKTVELKSFFNFNLTFALRQNGTLLATRGKKKYLLKR